ncbi:MAG: Spy/CpxP family protein refolding chaperone [Candidatus Sericytochromatia bacterium]
MKNLFKASLVSLSIAMILSACGSPSTVSLQSTDDSSTFTSAGQNPENIQGKGKGNKQGFKGGERGKEHGSEGFGQFKGIELTAEQKTALEALRPVREKKDPAAMKAQMEATQKAIKDAFLADTINRDSLKSVLTANQPPKPDFAKEAENMIKAYNILTAEQKSKLEANEKEMEAKAAEMKAKIDAKIASGEIKKPSAPTDKANPMIEKLATDLSLTAEQKTALQAVFAPPADANIDPATKHEQMKANRDAINSAVKSGDVSKLTELLSANKPTVDPLERHLDTIIKVHDILTAEQRAKAVEKLPILGFGGFGKGDHGRGHGPEGFGRPDKMNGHEKGGFGRPDMGGQMPQPFQQN